MANQPAKDKVKYTLFFHDDVLNEFAKMAEEETEKQGRPVTVPEIIRDATIKRANEHRKKQGKKLFDLDPSAGKFASWGTAFVAQVVVHPGGRIEAFNKRGQRVGEWKRLDQLEKICRLFPRVRVKHVMAYEASASERKRA